MQQQSQRKNSEKDDWFDEENFFFWQMSKRDPIKVKTLVFAYICKKKSKLWAVVLMFMPRCNAWVINLQKLHQCALKVREKVPKYDI